LIKKNAQIRTSQEVAENQPGRENVQGEVNREDEANDEEQAAAVSRTQPGSIVPGSTKPYEVVMIEGVRDYLLAHQLPFSDLEKKRKWSDVVKFIRESHPLAWPGVNGELKDPPQVGKIIKTNMLRIIKLRKEKRQFVRTSGFSGPQRTLLDTHVDEIILHDPPSSTNGDNGGTSQNDFISFQASSRSVAEKRRHGQLVRDASLTNVGTSRVRDPRIDSSFTDTMGMMAGALGRAVQNQENTRSDLFADRQTRERAVQEKERLEIVQQELRREEQEKKEREERLRMEKQESREQMNTTLQTFQLSVMRDLVKPAGGIAIPLPAAVQAVPAAVQVAPAAVQDEQSALKTLIVFYKFEDDSEQFPSEFQVRNISELKTQLSELCGIQNSNSKDIRIILNCREVLINILKVEDGVEYDVTKKVKPNLIKLYMDKRL